MTQTVSEYRATQMQKSLKRINHLNRMALIFASASVILAVTSIAIKFQPSVAVDLPEQNIQAIQCMSDNGDLATYHINIPLDVTNPANFIDGFCNSL